MSLPSGYKKLEYIQSSGTQYIDTGFKPNQNTRVVVDAKPLSVTQNQLWCIFGVRTSVFFELYKASTRNMRLTFLYGSTYTQWFDSLDYTKRHTFEINKNTATVDGTTLTYSAQTFQQAYPLFLFASNNTGKAEGIAAAELYSAKVYDNGTLIRDFIPCKNASGVIGLWDDVNSVFYQNAGSGTFTSGPEIKGAHKTLIDGTGYDVKAGKCLVGGTAYAVKKGRTLIDGTGYDISLESRYTLNISIDGGSGIAVSINIDGVYSTSLSQYEGLTKTITNIPEDTKISVHMYGNVGYNTITFYVNGAAIGAENENYTAEATISKNGSFTCVYKTDPTVGVGAYVFELNC